MTVHEKVVQPALEALRDPLLATANCELLDAFEKVRKGNYPDAITSCGAAFESVLKTICKAKGWPYDPDRDPPPWRTRTAAHTACAQPRATAARPGPAEPRPLRPFVPAHRSGNPGTSRARE
jgi:hypothetical protein